VILTGLVLYERFYQHPKYLNFRPDLDALHTFHDVFGNPNGPDPERDGVGTESGEQA
jgi:hypothetical protein